MKTGVQISIIYADEHLIELRVKASNGVFAGQAEMYANPEVFAEFADVLRGFPKHQNDAREFEFGSFDATYAGGGARFRFHCVDSLGHTVAEVKLRSEPIQKDGPGDAVTLQVGVEAAAIDSFVAQLMEMATVDGQVAVLETAT